MILFYGYKVGESVSVLFLYWSIIKNFKQTLDLLSRLQKKY